MNFMVKVISWHVQLEDVVNLKQIYLKIYLQYMNIS